MIARRVPVKGRHALPVQVPGIFINRIVILVVQEARGEDEDPIGELLLQPVVPLRIFPLEFHVDRHWPVANGHGEGHHGLVALNVPHGFDPSLDHIRLLEGEKQGEVFHRFHRFRLYKRILRQIYRFVIHELRRGGQRGHKTEQTIFYGKALDRLLDIRVGLLAHAHPPDIQSVNNKLLCIPQRIIDSRLRILRRR